MNLPLCFGDVILLVVPRATFDFSIVFSLGNFTRGAHENYVKSGCDRVANIARLCCVLCDCAQLMFEDRIVLNLSNTLICIREVSVQ